jgi:hypothetical protein
MTISRGNFNVVSVPGDASIHGTSEQHRSARSVFVERERIAPDAEHARRVSIGDFPAVLPTRLIKTDTASTMEISKPG